MRQKPQDTQRTTQAVWEVTLKCNLACKHCGSRAGERRERELDTAEALDLIRQLAEAGVRDVTLIGGEAYLRPDWLALVAEIRRRGMSGILLTGGLGISRTTAERLVQAGVASVSCSIDGLEETHDSLRGVTGSWRAALNTLEHVRTAGAPISVNTQVNRRTMPDLPGLYDLLRTTGVHSWQIQLTMPMGRAADQADLLLQPYEVLELMPVLGTLAERCRADGIRLLAGDNIGYYGPYEALLRGSGDAGQYWQGCHAGILGLGIEAHGAVKACGSLPSASYVGGNVREKPLSRIVLDAPELGFNRLAYERPEEATAHLWGFCRSCYYAQVCRGGCTWVAEVLFGRRGNNPYCHHRALELQARGLRERLELVSPAPGQTFDHALFRLIDESWPTP